MDQNDIAYLSGRIAQGEVILFTVAGFSVRAQAEDGKPIPSAHDLLHELWPLAYGDAEYDGSSLGDVYGAAKRAQGNATKELMRKRLTVCRQGLPDEYRIWFSFPWYRVYTLNIDNLEDIVQLEYSLPRKLRSLSALSDAPPAPLEDLLVVHLNGTLDDLPNVTFSPQSYAERQAHPDLWYPLLVRELTAHPVLFVGSSLDEPPLWQYIEARPRRGRGDRELRPKSFLVTPKLSLGRQSSLGEFNIRFEQDTQEGFCAGTLSQLGDAAEAGIKQLRSTYLGAVAAPPLLSISELTARPLNDAPELLLGREPRWADVTNGYAVERAFDLTTLATIQTDGVRLALITGTAGSGKTLSAMRTALALSADQHPGYVLNEDFTTGAVAIRRAAKAANAGVLVVDDADRFGRLMPDLLTSLIDDSPNLVVIATIRTTRLDDLALEKLRMAGATEFPVPPLEDGDIEGLLDALTEARRLGELRTLGRAKQASIFRHKCGRQLLVAMIEATSGLRFNEKVASECRQLEGDQAMVYAVLAIATAEGASLTRGEVLTACAGNPATINTALQLLIDRHLVMAHDTGRLAIRHRVIAERALDYFQQHRSLGTAIEGLAFALASTAQPLDYHSRQNKLLRRLLNHATLIRLLFPQTPGQIDLEAVRSVFETVEGLLTDNPHFWLQRGSYEVEEGDLGLARNYLGQARAMRPDDPRVITEWAYMLLKCASQHAGEPHSADDASEAFALLEEVIETRGATDSYPYHVYGSQGLAWIKRSPTGTEARAKALDNLCDVVRKGTEQHPESKELRQLLHDLKHEYLMLATNPPK